MHGGRGRGLGLDIVPLATRLLIAGLAGEVG